ncbi:MAG TPA: tetratricopeptide repeat protein [bacterium]|nr:tetratricopeptide repeat protein [bacterium]
MAGKSKAPIIIIAGVLTAGVIAAAVIAYVELRDPIKALESGRRPAWAAKELAVMALANPDDYRVQSWLIRLDLEAGRMGPASSRLDMMIIKAPDNYYTFHGSCLLDMKKRNFSAAAKSCQRALDMSPARTTEDVHLAASSFLETGQLEASLPLLQELWKRTPDDPKVINNLGYNYMQLSRNEQALELFQQALKLDPGMATARRNLARTCLKMGKYPEAIDAFKSLLTTFPADLEAMAALSSIYATQVKDAKTARYYYDLAVKNGLDKNRAILLNAKISGAGTTGKSQQSQPSEPAPR